MPHVSRMSYGVYILRCADNTYYTGLTNDLERRVATHNAGRGARYTRSRLPVEALFWWDNLSKRDAYRVEWMIKQLSRTQKQCLIDGDERLLNRLKKRLVA
ncbi:GIY-YIG nuclease family protein [Anaerolineales bacterium HSG24]|nr:GIY-YIG nuclease family protein [Anaerolineales bacterium HSG24]